MYLLNKPTLYIKIFCTTEFDMKTQEDKLIEW